jgi:hypothetical protein
MNGQTTLEASSNKDNAQVLIETRNLFERREQLPSEGTWDARFLAMVPANQSQDEHAAFFYFTITNNSATYVAGFMASKRLTESSLTHHLWKVLTGKPPSGYISDMSPYRDCKLRVEIVHGLAKRTNRYYAKVIGVYPPLKKESSFLLR